MEIKLWKDFEDVTSPLVEWIEKVEIDVKERETYGDSLEEAEEFMRNIVVSFNATNYIVRHQT